MIPPSYEIANRGVGEEFSDLSAEGSGGGSAAFDEHPATRAMQAAVVSSAREVEVMV
jgi:hypothetical protein